MKKNNLIFIIVFAIILLNCSSENENTNSDNTILGFWKPLKQINECSDGTQEIFNRKICEQNGRTNFLSNGNFNTTQFEEDNNGIVQNIILLKVLMKLIMKNYLLPKLKMEK